MTDNVTKLLLAAIALGLWANAAAHMLQPAKAQSMDKNLMDSMNNINTNLHSIDGRLAVFTDDLHLIMAGRCQNRQLCRR
jgi:ATP/maltotriose-dependent transcriptional regulator MalT